jgi:small subunit ribosomal protein S20
VAAEKTARASERKRLRNRVARTKTRTAVKQARAAIAQGGKETQVQVLDAMRELDKAAQKGVIHKNAAARSKSRLAKRLVAKKA